MTLLIQQNAFLTFLLVLITFWCRFVDAQDTYCGCSSCTADQWNLYAGEYTCGARITWVIQNDPSVNGSTELACAKVAVEFPSICGASCNPKTCGGGPAPSPKPPSNNLYCFPPASQRKRYTNVWGKYTVEVKDSQGNGCGPGWNQFSTKTVVRAGQNHIKLRFQYLNGVWVGSEVRVILPNGEPFTYGTYSFNVRSVSWTRDGKSRGKSLPPSLVFGLFTWDDTDNYAIRENYSHEVDIEFSRWNDPKAADAQFLVQPPGNPQTYRFFTGPNNSRNPGGTNRNYQFTWNPGQIDWYTNAGGGHNFTYSTKQAINGNTQDLVQCLPANVEIRMNLWNMLDANTPTNMQTNDIVEVVVNNFTYTPSGLKGIRDGNACTKNCQCKSGSTCTNQVCTPQ